MKKQLTLRKLAVVGFSAMALSMFAFSAQALPMVTNGSFETVVGAVPAEITNTNLPGWSITGSFLACVTQTAATDACGAGGSAGAKLWLSPGLSPDLGNFVLIDGDPAFSQTLSQTVNGLVAGQFYDVSFYQSTGQFQSFSGATTEQWRVTFGGDTQFSTLMSTASHGTVPWQHETLTFLATSTTQVLGFFAVGAPGGLPPVVLLDGVSITTIPEPETLALLGIGLLGILVTSRQQKKRA